jgi:hypothetical protein
VLELVYRLDLKSSDQNHVGSSPSSDTWEIIKYSVNTNNNIGEIIEFGSVIKASKFIETKNLV